MFVFEENVFPVCYVVGVLFLFIKKTLFIFVVISQNTLKIFNDEIIE